MHKNYRLTGFTVDVKLKAGTSDAYPWMGATVPVKIIKEYPTFLAGIVLPHKNPRGWDTSHPYPITIDKHDVATGIMIINGGAIA